MSQGRHAAPRHAATKGGAPGGSTSAGARRAPSRAAAPRTQPSTAGAGRRIAERPGAVAVIRASSVGTLTAVAPVAVLSVACIVGLGASPGGPAAARDGAEKQPLAPTSSPFAQAGGKHRAVGQAQTPAQTVASSSRATGQQSAEVGVVGPVQAIHHAATQPTTTSPNPTATPTVSPTASLPSVLPTLLPTPEPTSPAPSEAPSATSSATPLTQAQATAQCLADGISALDVAGLADCVDALLNP